MVTTCGAAVRCRRRDTIIIGRRRAIGRRLIDIKDRQRRSRILVRNTALAACRSNRSRPLINLSPIKARLLLLHAFGSSLAESRQPDVLALAIRAIDRSLPQCFANLHRYPVHLHPSPIDAGIVRLNNAVETGKDLHFFHVLSMFMRC